MLTGEFIGWIPPPKLDFLIACSKTSSAGEFETLCVLWWRVWQRRNQAVHGGLLIPVSEIWDWAISFIDDFRGANNSGAVCKPFARVVDRWQAPPLGVFKINTDVVTRSSNRISGIGVVIRDNLGRVKASFCKQLNAYFEPQIAETLVILRGINLAVDIGLFPVMLESDVLSVVNAIVSKEVPSSEVGVVVQDILNL
ncbi:hypothetical protein LWI28_007108 [Acer negundo]|uniref:RNase H type-1 domain-containing protein n=1 Tax=Acer negundo TaxID=4023 RepID=A0AAD5IQA7_ACENE|nr:hypothetical protein LWI28_007108 [Acer negundo]KAK4843439.1 hypothetical protein QYF36_008040 [Acer negundo]